MKIPLSNCSEFTEVDPEDFPLISRITWFKDPEGYVRTGNIRLHQLVCGFPHLCDHIDRNKLNNQKNNLRQAGRQENAFNSGPRCHNKSGYKGVSKTRSGKWATQINKTIGGISSHFYLGAFSLKEEAARVYDKKARELFGEFAFLNFPEEV